MSVHRHNLKPVVDAAWASMLKTVRDDHRHRSEDWVSALAREFSAHYPATKHRVFWRSNPRADTDFRLSEFLFDIAVCSVSYTCSLQRIPKCLPYVSHCHWLVESEFARNTRSIIVDMSKLVVGHAEGKLFVAAQRSSATERALLDRCVHIAERCRSDVFFAFVAHPDQWRSAPAGPRLHAWSADGWRAMVATGG